VHLYGLFLAHVVFSSHICTLYFFRCLPWVTPEAQPSTRHHRDLWAGTRCNVPLHSILTYLLLARTVLPHAIILCASLPLRHYVNFTQNPSRRPLRPFSTLCIPERLTCLIPPLPSVLLNATAVTLLRLSLLPFSFRHRRSCLVFPGVLPLLTFLP
jgi:hypothetical protein